MADICCGVVSDSEASSAACEGGSRAARRRRMEIRRFKFVAEVPPEMDDEGAKRRKIEIRTASLPATSPVGGFSGVAAIKNEELSAIKIVENGGAGGEIVIPTAAFNTILNRSISASIKFDLDVIPKYGVSSVCGRRRDMEDMVTVRPSLLKRNRESSLEMHYFGVYDGHGCSHVAARCRDRMHELVREELMDTTVAEETMSGQWIGAMAKSFCRMDKEVTGGNGGVLRATCRCEMQTPECDAVGSTAVVAIVTSSKIIVANCGDSRAVLCRNGKAVPLSTDHKPDRPEELNRIEAAGGRVIYWDCPRVSGVLAMSRSIGDNYLKPYVSCEPEVTITERTAEDECLILASDGLWDVVSNETACGVARMCLKEKDKGNIAKAIGEPAAEEKEEAVGGGDKACTDASMLLTKLALARHSTDNVSVVVVDLRRDT